jgi:anti-anti-sigma regulatory factor
VAIRITTIERDGTTILKVDGQLVGDEARVLLRACGSVPGRLVLDLTDLWFVDRQGTRMLLELRQRGSTLTGLSPYLRLWFDRNAGDPAR